MSQSINSKPRTQISSRIALIASIVTICVALNIFIGFFWGAFPSWKSLPAFPSGAKHIIDADPYGLWVEATNHQVFSLSIYCFREENCQLNHWILVKNAAEIVTSNYGHISREDNCTTFPYGESPGNPGGNILECVKTVSPGMDIVEGHSVYFALMADGSVKYLEQPGYPSGLLCMAPSIVLILVTTAIYLIKNLARKKQKVG